MATSEYPNLAAWLRRNRLAVSLFLLGLFSISPVASCSCDDNLTGDVWDMTPPCKDRNVADICPPDTIYRKGECAPIRCDADLEVPNCCPGQLCVSTGECRIPASRVKTCETNEGCPSGQMCLERPLVSSEKTCGYLAPDENGDCPEELRLFAGRCLVNAPCNGACDSGEVCNIDLNACEDVPPYLPNENHGCDQQCGEGELLVYEDPDVMLFDKCCEVRCRCEILPPLKPGIYGRFASLEVSDTDILVSSYDDTYGDLVLAHFDQTRGLFTHIEYIDGVPNSGPQLGAPSGLRGGYTDPGPNVGQYTSLIIQNGQPVIAYYDVDNLSLKYAVRQSDGSWSISVIDDGRTWGDGADVGRYIDLAIGSDGYPRVSYMLVHGFIDGSTEEQSAALYAEATTTNPASYDDWQHLVVEQQIIPSVPCNGQCGEGEICVSDGNSDNPRTQCLTPSSDCDPKCESKLRCVLVEATPTCRLYTPIPLAGGIAVGTGLYNNLVFDNGVPLVVFHDSINGTLKVAKATVTGDGAVDGFEEPLVLDGGSMVIDGSSYYFERGRFADAHFDMSGLLGISYLDETAGELRYCSGRYPNFTTTVVDSGVRSDGKHRVGADSQLAYLTDLDPVILYQDSTMLDLMIAKSDGGSWSFESAAPCSHFCTAEQICVGDALGQAVCMEAADEVVDCQNECSEQQRCVHEPDETFACRQQKLEIANGFYLSSHYDENGHTLYVSDLEIAFDIFERRANIQGVRIFDTSGW